MKTKHFEGMRVTKKIRGMDEFSENLRGMKHFSTKIGRDIFHTFWAYTPLSELHRAQQLDRSLNSTPLNSTARSTLPLNSSTFHHFRSTIHHCAQLHHFRSTIHHRAQLHRFRSLDRGLSQFRVSISCLNFVSQFRVKLCEIFEFQFQKLTNFFYAYSSSFQSTRWLLWKLRDYLTLVNQLWKLWRTKRKGKVIHGNNYVLNWRAAGRLQEWQRRLRFLRLKTDHAQACPTLWG